MFNEEEKQKQKQQAGIGKTEQPAGSMGSSTGSDSRQSGGQTGSQTDSRVNPGSQSSGAGSTPSSQTNREQGK